MDETTLNSRVDERPPKKHSPGKLVIVVILIFVGVASGLSMANQFGVSRAAAKAASKGNARTVQIAAESYATDSGGAYGSLESIAPYLPGGSNTIDGPRQPIPANASEIKNVDLDKIRAGYVPENLVPNHVYYSVLESGNSYAVFGTDEFGNITTRGVGDKPMVLSNQ